MLFKNNHLLLSSKVSALVLLSSSLSIASLPSSRLEDRSLAERVLSIPGKMGEIASDLSREDIVALGVLSKSMKESIDEHTNTKLKELTTQALNNFDLTGQSEIEKKILITKARRHTLEIHLTERLEKQDVFFMDSRSTIRRHVDLLIEKKTLSHTSINGFDLYKDHKEIFRKALFQTEGVKNKEDEIFQDVVAQHILASLTVFHKTETFQEKDLQKLIKQAVALKNKINFVRFSEDLKIGGENLIDAHIIVTDGEINNGQNKAHLKTLLAENPNHHIILEVNSTFVDTNGSLSMSKEDIPDNVAHLTIININGNITSIEDEFLLGAESLISFDTRGLINLTSVGGSFLREAISLTSFDSRGLINLKSIRYGFLYKATKLVNLDTRGFISLTSMGDKCLYMAESLVSLDTQGFRSLTSIGDYFLYKATNFTSLDTRGLINLTTIGKYFITQTTKLTSIDVRGLMRLTSMGNSFLDRAENFEKIILMKEQEDLIRSNISKDLREKIVWEVVGE